MLSLIAWPTLSRSDGPYANKQTDATVLAAERAPSQDGQSDEKGLGQRSEREVGVGDELGFRQQGVAVEMSDFEQRMFRLSEALKLLEPENSSRLLLGLKYAREELILHQMKETQEALLKLSLKGAIEEQKQLIAKLERLQQVLLSTDLDFDMRLERLRQIRDVLRKLDTVIKEESREEKISKQAAEAEKKLADLAKRREALESLVKQQTEHVAKNGPLAAKAELNDDERASAAKLGEAQDKTRQETDALNAQLQDGASSPNLTQASGSMKSAAGSLAKASASEAAPAMQQALEALKKDLAETLKKEAAAKAELTRERFAAMQKDQQGNHAATNDITDLTRQLGSSGTSALSELMRAGGFMGGAEGAFGGGQAGQGNGEQGKALASLKYAEELLAEEAERLAQQLRGEVKKRVLAGLNLMLEEQTIVRKRTEAIASGVKERSREALSGMTALATREEKITGVAQELINIVEETEFGITLPAALAAVRDATEGVRISLAAGDASDEVTSAEKQIEIDLKEMIEIVSEMTDLGNKKKGRPQKGRRDERKELDKIITELRMIQLLEKRVEQNTRQLDTQRANVDVSPILRKRIEELEGRQEDIRDATERLAEERANDLPQQ